jgi:hypothetical protein
MHRRRTILLAVAMTVFALPYSAQAYTMERVQPAEEYASIPAGVAYFEAQFGGLSPWTQGWLRAEWYVDGELTKSEGLGGGTKETSSLNCHLTYPGPHQVKVRAQYFIGATLLWTDYLVWNPTLFCSDPPTASRVSPDSPVTVQEGDMLAFTAIGTEPGAGGDCLRIPGVRWYLDGEQQDDIALSEDCDPPFAIPNTWSHTFDTPGTHFVEARFYDFAGCLSAPGEAVWTVVVGQPSQEPIAAITSPASPVTAYTGIPVTFTAQGMDPDDDLNHCEVYLNDVFQTNADFTGSASGSTANWTHTFNAPGTYRIAFTPLDWAGNYGPAAVWTVVAKPDPEQAGLNVLVVERDARRQAQGPLAGAQVDLTGPTEGTAITDGRGRVAFIGLNPGAYTVNVSKAGYYAQSRSVSLAAGETKDEAFQLAPESLEPVAFDFTSPGGKHLIEGLPGDLSFSVTVAWNGPPGSVRFDVAGTWHPAALTDLGEGLARASLTIPAPATVSACRELTVEVANGEGERTTVHTGVYLYPLPDIISKWYPDLAWWAPSEGGCMTVYALSWRRFRPTAGPRGRWA